MAHHQPRWRLVNCRLKEGALQLVRIQKRQRRVGTTVRVQPLNDLEPRAGELSPAQLVGCVPPSMVTPKRFFRQD